MSTDATGTAPPSVHADLAYLKALVDGDGRQGSDFPAAYLLAGVVYGVQIVLQWLGYLEILPIEGTPIYLVVVTAPTAILIGFTSWQAWRSRNRRSANPATRAINAVFQGAGLVNLAVIVAIVAAAIGQRAYTMILIYAAVIFALQGGCWFVVYSLRRRLWMLAVALGWLASGAALGFALGGAHLNVFIGICLFDCWLLMALPGAVMLHNARKASP
jgi:hypothetical protein